MDIPLWLWCVTLGLTTTLLLVDVLVIGRRPHEPSVKELVSGLAFYVGLAAVFGIGVWHFAGGRFGGEFFAGWLTEYSLSIDNLFVFIIVMGRLGVPRRLQQSALLVGIVLALVMRGVFIAVGAAAIDSFSWVFYVFGAFLVYTAVKVAKPAHAGPGGSAGSGGSAGPGGDVETNRLVRWVERRLPTTSDYRGTKVLVRENGRLLATPMLVVILALGTTDLLFALDSIPAIYGLTQEPYLVLTANIFALMGLRQLYFLLGGLLQRLVFLSYGLAALLGFIGVKLVLHALHENELPFVNGGDPVGWAPDIPISVSLGVILGTLGVTTVASLVRSRQRAGAA